MKRAKRSAPTVEFLGREWAEELAAIHDLGQALFESLDSYRKLCAGLHGPKVAELAHHFDSRRKWKNCQSRLQLRNHLWSK